jgi:trimeric autotransporter adhesin
MKKLYPKVFFVPNSFLIGSSRCFTRLQKTFFAFSLSIFFSLQVFAQPANDECSNATARTSGTSCNITSSSMKNATASAGIPGIACVAGVHYDVWFKFIAASSIHTATISNRGSNFTNPDVQIFSGTCAALTQLACGATAATATGLTVGTTYYVRVSNVGAAVTSNAGFDMCITHPLPAPANDDCSGATTLTPNYTCTTTTGNLRYATSGGPAGACGGATATTTFDVWFRFQATATTQAVTLNSLGANLTAASTYFEVLSGACGGLTSMACQAASVTNGRMVLSTLTVGAFYYVRVYVLLSPTATATTDWNFNICVQQPPANDECAGAIVLTSGVTCTNTSGTLDLATPSVVPLGCFAIGTYYDVWYSFVATGTTHTITLNGLGANFTAPRIQVYTGTCGALVTIGCAVAPATIHIQTGLTIGTTYYVRIANFGINPSGTGSVANFNICVTGNPAPPSNDLCTGAIGLTSGATCSNISGTLINATATAGLAACGNAASPDVWFSFVAQSTYPIITLGSPGVDLTTAAPRIQLFSGACGTITALTGACVASPLNTATTPGGAGLTVGATYYIRITTLNLTGPVTTGTYTFALCVTDPIGAAIDYGKSYVNITTGTVGSTINPNDVLEIRATLVVGRPGGAGAIKAIDSIAFYDTLSAGKGFQLLADNMALRTNEGKLFRPSSTTYFTDAAADADAGWITTAGPGTDTALQINMGLGATRAARGKLRTTSKPSNYGATCIIMATYRVRVTAAYGTAIDYGGGSFRYRDTATGIFYTINFPKDSLMVYSSPGACPDAVSATNVVGDEFNGTFGAPLVSAGSQNRGTSPNTSYGYKPFSANTPNDYYYGVANNTSAANTIVQTVPKPNAARVFSAWDISGDHTGAVNTGNTSQGNKPCNPGLPIGPTNPCGYMLAINSAYHTDVAFEFNVNGACTETYYEISAWIKNICYKCGCDSNGVSASSGGYLPTAPGDSAGIRPNIAFQIDGIDYYTTGDLLYQGFGGTQTGSDTLNKWVKRSFIYKTNPAQSSFKITFRNNAPGGGGNDWVIDDISIRTCYPNMIYSPTLNPSVCANNILKITDTVRSFYNVYIHYKWQRSIDGGTNWVDLAGSSGVASTVWNGSSYEYVNSYTIPPSATTPANNGNLYRMVVATTAANLAGSCNYSEISPVTITVLNNCLDIDDDNDGIPDYVEFNNPVALQDANSNGIPNWNDPTYAGYIDNNIDGVNDNFDYGADANGNGIPNYLDATFPGFIDSNADGVNDNSDKDLDGIPNQLDLDSDNDGIPDVVESYGVDTNGNGIIDNYVDTDGDGFSQNVDANNTGVAGSNVGLGAQDFDADGIPNYLDTDSDNDGIPDAVEVGGADGNNNGKIDGFIDTNYDGISDNNVNAAALLITGVDIATVDGRADDWPNKNLDHDFRPNAYDLDSDGDGIVDVVEAGLPDANLNGIVDGAIATNGWSATVAVMAALNLRNTDGIGNADYLDIDADDDGITDNIEAQTTAGYKLPVTTDTDGDGLVNIYDNVAGFGGSGIFVYDNDGDGRPDYRDLDTDGDGALDIVEGNDFNLNGFADDLVTLTGLDTDGDGLDNRFDSLNSVTNIKGTSFNMGTGGVTLGDPAPGTRAPVQMKLPTQLDRDWRYIGMVLPVEFLNFTAVLQNAKVPLNWMAIANKEIDRFEIERSADNSTYAKIGIVTGTVKLNEPQSFGFTDDITGINSSIIYYRLKVIAKTGEIRYSNVLFVRVALAKTPVTIMPNPASSNVSINLYVDKSVAVKIILLDKVGKKVLSQNESLTKGFNNINLNLDKFSEGVYAIIIETPVERIVRQLMIIR